MKLTQAELVAVLKPKVYRIAWHARECKDTCSFDNIYTQYRSIAEEMERVKTLLDEWAIEEKS